MRLTLARLLLLAGVLAQGATSVRAQQSLEVQPHSSSDSAATAEAGADKSALIDQSTLPNATEVKGSRPRVDPSVMEPAKTSLTKPLSSLASPASLALPTTTSEVKIKELRPLTLAEVEELAEVNSPSLKQAKSKVEQARLTLSAAYSAWYPTIGVSSGLSYKDQELHNASKENEYTEQYSYTQDWTTSFSATASWNLIDPKRVPQIAKARDTYEMERNTYLISLRDLRLNAANTYFELQRQDEGVDVAQSGLRASLVSLRDAKARFKAGVATKLEVLEAETQLSQDQTQLTDYLGKQSFARRSLANLLDLPQNITPTAADPTRVVGLWQPSLEESIIAAYAFREELDKLILQISTNNSDANISLANIQPVIDLLNTFGSQRQEGSVGTPVSQIDWGNYTWSADNTVSLGFKWTIFDGGRAWADYRKNKQKAQGSEFQFASQRNAIRAEVEQSFYELKTSTQTLKSTGMGVLSARESLRLSRLRFQAGVASQREVVDNQRDLTRNQQLYANSMTLYNKSIYNLRRRTGLDLIEACAISDLPVQEQKGEIYNPIDVPINPIPLENPACKVSILQAD